MSIVLISAWVYHTLDYAKPSSYDSCMYMHNFFFSETFSFKFSSFFELLMRVPLTQVPTYQTYSQKKKLFGCPPPPAPNFWKLEKLFTVQKYTAPSFQNSKKRFVFFCLENSDLLKIFFKLLFSTCLHFNTDFKLV